MSGRYSAYPAYDASVAEWQDGVPTGWSSLALGRIFRRVKRSGYSDEELLSVYRDHGVIPKASRDDNFNKASEDLSPYQLVLPGDLVMNKMKAWQGSIAMSEHQGIVSPAYFVYQPWRREDDRMEPKYIHYLLRSPAYITQYLSRSKGIRVNQWDLDPGAFERIEVLLPPLAEQTQIAKFLDYETAKIDALIEKQQQLIALLKEKRQAVISHAVTKGLNPDACMRDSGVEWLGEVPDHWSICCIKHVIPTKKDSMVDGPFGSSVNTDVDYVAIGIPVVRTVNITNDAFSSDSLKFMREEKFSQLKRHAVYPGDVLFSKVGTIGNSCVLPQSVPEAILSTTGSCKITVDPDKCVPEFLVFCIQSMYEKLMQIANANVQPFLNMGNIKNLKLPLPSVHEQKEILLKLGIDLKKLDAVISKAGSSAELLQERRIALISAAVTGKIDVRGWKSSDSESEVEVA